MTFIDEGRRWEMAACVPPPKHSTDRSGSRHYHRTASHFFFFTLPRPFTCSTKMKTPRIKMVYLSQTMQKYKTKPPLLITAFFSLSPHHHRIEQPPPPLLTPLTKSSQTHPSQPHPQTPRPSQTHPPPHPPRPRYPPASPSRAQP